MARSSVWLRVVFLFLMILAAWPLLVDRQNSFIVQASLLERLPADTAATTHVLSYQGRLADPTTGAPKADGSYSMTFRVYDAASAGTILWTEIKDVPVSKGLFSTLLGDTTALPSTIFDGNDRWLGIKVGADTETVPRMRMAFVPYASWALNAGALEGQGSSFYRNASNINAGTLADGNIAASITRDGEVMGIVTGNDGSGSGVDADLLDGIDSAGFASAGHTHTGATIQDGTITSDDIQDLERTLTIPAHALSVDATSTVVKRVSTGLQWQQSFSGPAFLTIAQPSDWDGTSNITMRIYFMPTTGAGGNVDFFIRPRAYSAGDKFADVNDISGTPVAATGVNIIKEQLFTIPSSRFGSKPLWMITIQNQGSGSTYTDDVIVLAVTLTYTAVR
ncbi:MAG: hypothetical protein KF753_13120 [Caldilineaceae bacterium]|nr:hypothetical protein [Caldilineaceae bacterium]